MTLRSLKFIFLLVFALGGAKKVDAQETNSSRIFRAGVATANTTPFLGTPLEGVISKAGPATYETWPGRNAYLEVSAAEKIQNEILRLLKTVAETTP